MGKTELVQWVWRQEEKDNDMLKPAGDRDPSDGPIESVFDLEPDWNLEIWVETETDDEIIREITVARGGEVWNEKVTINKDIVDQEE
jgi:hypothetical protein